MTSSTSVSPSPCVDCTRPGLNFSQRGPTPSPPHKVLPTPPFPPTLPLPPPLLPLPPPLFLLLLQLQLRDGVLAANHTK